ncbi:guanine nucleotide binding protein, alpha subunit [Rhodofomes roseus]|uniref:Guanine nucleotide binding protein, alpha subunit n=1 Tax=Rhodofomes roseus TaxID=34475 RepID=A0ABQ8KC97_9APHY|nr:guanine nucleotide binding protein, alpha subunit [Rhodofomes roseus]KAH9835198.1 guanine nucleotide binding protein, alpha subunit [Rhodofomes roseus]
MAYGDKMSGVLTPPDPLDVALRPPEDENEEDRSARLSAEEDARKVSEMIDEELKAQERAEKRGPKPIKVLLLGQSESGKSTTLKNFQLMNSPKAFRAERASWRAVIHLNVVRSIHNILEAMAEAQNAQAQPSTPTGGRPSRSRTPSDSSTRVYPPLTAEHLKLKMRLSPLLQVEQALIRKLTPPGSAEFEATHLAQASNVSYLERIRQKEVAVNSLFAWKGVFGRLLSDSRDADSGDGIDWNDPQASSEVVSLTIALLMRQWQDPGRIIHACGEDMIRLWNDETIRSLLQIQGIRLEDRPGFFLDSLERVTSPRYVPTDEDILRARLKTLGITEYRFSIKEGTLGGITRDWRIYDVGGHRSLRAAWAPYFDDMNAILFLAPISCFDQTLEEDPTVNRLEDSVVLWKTIVSNPLLAKTSIVLFLNKVDIFKAKLEAGIKLSKYIVSYGNRTNDFDSTSIYLKRKFAQIHKERSPEPRMFYCHFTTVTDTKSTQHILADVQDTVVVRSLKDSSLIS